jgi:NAD-dependent dihydropyrimidine dehydrogenase PreA subunit
MFMPKIDEEKCDQCAECLDICPTDVFEPDGEVMHVANPADCIGCESCIAVCAGEAITLQEV